MWPVLVGIPLAAVLGYGMYVMVITGQLRMLEPVLPGPCQQVSGIPGGEDLVVLPDGHTVIVSSVDRRAEMAGKPVSGNLMAIDLNDPKPTPRPLLNPAPEGFSPHGLGLYTDAAGKSSLFVVNHLRASMFHAKEGDGPKHAVDVYDVVNGELIHRRQYTDPLLVSPNDVGPIDHERFYVSNDHGSADIGKQTVEDFGRLRRAGVVYFNGQRFSHAIDKLRTANGVIAHPSRPLVYVAESTNRTVSTYQRADDGTLTRTARQNLGTGVDNLHIDEQGNLWVAAHPKMLKFLKYAKNPNVLSPSEVLKLVPQADGSLAVSTVFLEAGAQLSASSVGIPVGNRLVVGSVMDPHVLVCEMPK